MTTRPLTADERIQEVVGHEHDCNAGLHNKEAVQASQAEYDWRVVEPYDGRPWMSWEMLGYDLKDERHKAEWTYCADLSHAFTGLVRLKPGQRQPTHTHTTPEIYYILQVNYYIIIISSKKTVLPCSGQTNSDSQQHL